LSGFPEDQETSDEESDAEEGQLQHDRVAVCASLAGLTGLQDLRIHNEDLQLLRDEGSWYVLDDVAALTALNGLTALWITIPHDHDSIDEQQFARVAASMQQLRHLHCR
jgi:hypothetical protein